jgi:FeS assembly SUF system protein
METTEKQPINSEKIREEVIRELTQVYDPEIPVNIYDLGLIYNVEVDEKGEVDILMTFTSPACPTAGSILNEVNYRASGVEGVEDVRVRVTWDPPWTKELCSERARIELSQIFGEF